MTNEKDDLPSDAEDTDLKPKGESKKQPPPPKDKKDEEDPSEQPS